MRAIIVLFCLFLYGCTNKSENSQSSSVNEYSEEEMLEINKGIRFGMTIDTLNTLGLLNDIHQISDKICFGWLKDPKLGNIQFDEFGAFFVSGKLINVQYTSILQDYDEVKDILNAALNLYESKYGQPISKNSFPENIKPNKKYELFKFEIGDKTIKGLFCKNYSDSPAIQTDISIKNDNVIKKRIRGKANVSKQKFDTLYASYGYLEDLNSKDWPYCEYKPVFDNWAIKLSEIYKYVYKNKIVYIDTVTGQEEDFEMFKNSYLIKKVDNDRWIVSYKRYLKDDKVFEIKAK